MEPTTQEQQNGSGTNTLTPTDVTITLKVKAAELFAYGNYTYKQNRKAINDCCELDDGTNISGFGGNKEYYTSEVDLDKDVKWEAELNSPEGQDRNYEVEVTSYDYESSRSNNTNFFVQDRISDVGGKVTGRVKNDPTLEDKEDTYSIDFRITEKDSRKSHEFKIDPKLRIKPKFQLFIIKD